MKNTLKVSLCLCVLFPAANGFGQTYPYFTAQPANQTLNQGFSGSFRATAFTTNPPVSYQWYFNTNAIPWATTNTLTITNAQPTNAGGYYAVATDGIGFATSRVATLTVIPPAVLDPKIGANIRLGEDPAELPTSRRAQGEPHIARSGSDPRVLIATCMEGVASDSALGCGYSVSTNGGLTWSPRALIPGITTLRGGTYARAADAVAAGNSGGDLYVTTLGGSATPASLAMLISKSTDGGQSFATPRKIFFTDSTYDPDKEWIAINPHRNSATFNRIAVAFTREGGSNQVHCLHSDDGGSTWSSPTPLGSPDASDVQLVFLPDGSLIALYVRYLCGYLGEANCTVLELVRSEDGGASFGPPVLVQSLAGIAYHETLAFNWSLPSLTADQQAGVLYLTYPVLLGPATNIPSILFRKSIDKGATWTAPIVVNDTPNLRSVAYPAISASPDGQHVMISFYDRRNQTATSGDYFYDLYLAESFDGGDTWQPNLRLSEFSSDLRLAPLIFTWRWVCDYQGIVPALNFDIPGVAVWIDSRAGNLDPYAVRINRTKGTTFDSWRKLRWGTNDLATPTISGEKADPDADGIPNLAEYALGLEPNHVDAGPLRILQNAEGRSASVTVSYERLALLSDVQFTWQTSTDLLDWSSVTPAQEDVGTGQSPWMQRVVASFPANEQAGFLRLAIARLPSP